MMNHDPRGSNKPIGLFFYNVFLAKIVITSHDACYSNLCWLVYSDLSISGNARVFAQLYAVNGLIGLAGTAEVFGKLMADEIALSGAAKLHFNTFKSDHIP